MGVQNKTDFDTAYLKKLFIACEKHEGTDHRHRVVEIKKARGSCVNG
jgi:hypothetical protein